MSEALKCTSCGATNQLTEGKISMVCTYCGNAINRPTIESNSDRLKPSLSKTTIDSDFRGTLSYVNRNITSINDISEIYSDNELQKVHALDLSNNHIKSLCGLERYNLGRLNLSNNEIEIIDALPNYHRTYGFDFNFSNNKNLTGFSENVITEINDLRNIDLKIGDYYTVFKININLYDCPNFDFTQLRKIAFSKLNFKNKSDAVVFFVNTSERSLNAFKELGFDINIGNGEKCYCTYPSKESRKSSSVGDSIFTNIFSEISIMDWLYLIAPYILAFIVYSGTKTDNDSHLGLLDFTLGFLIIGIAVRFYPFFSRRVKTGRSFQSKNSRFDEYNTVEGKVNAEYGFWVVSILHVLAIVLILKFHTFGSSNNESGSTEPTTQNHSNSFSNATGFNDTFTTPSSIAKQYEDAGDDTTNTSPDNFRNYSNDNANGFDQNKPIASHWIKTFKGNFLDKAGYSIMDFSLTLSRDNRLLIGSYTYFTLRGRNISVYGTIDSNYILLQNDTLGTSISANLIGNSVSGKLTTPTNTLLFKLNGVANDATVLE